MACLGSWGGRCASRPVRRGAAEVVRPGTTIVLLAKQKDMGGEGCSWGGRASVIIPTSRAGVSTADMICLTMRVPSRVKMVLYGCLGGQGGLSRFPRESVWHGAWCRGVRWFVYFSALAGRSTRARGFLPARFCNIPLLIFHLEAGERRLLTKALNELCTPSSFS
jgi:hypothetical protein